MRSFHAYHLRFDSSANATLDVKRVKFFSRPLFACPARRRLVGVLEGTSISQHCPWGFTGRKLLHCERDEASNSKAVWREDVTQCFETNPDNGLDFVDWSFTIKGMSAGEWERREKQLTEMLVANTYLREKNIRFLYQDWNAEQEQTEVTVAVRCTLDTLFGELIQRDLKRLAPVFDAAVKEAVSPYFDAHILSVHIRPPRELGGSNRRNDCCGTPVFNGASVLQGAQQEHDASPPEERRAVGLVLFVTNTPIERVVPLLHVVLALRLLQRAEAREVLRSMTLRLTRHSHAPTAS